MDIRVLVEDEQVGIVGVVAGGHGRVLVVHDRQHQVAEAVDGVRGKTTWTS